jgi:long-chain acyl-CoA synthetase
MKFLTEATGLPLGDSPSPGWIFERIEEWSRRLPDQFAFVMEHQDGDDEYKYTDVLRESNNVAASLAARGIQPGDRIGILVETIPQWVFILLGAMRIGAVTVPLATALPEAHVQNIAGHAGCRIIFADEPNLAKACNVTGRLGAETIALNGSDPRAMSWSAFQAGTRQSEIFSSLNGDATVLLIYTSGTTGDPKGVELTMFNLIYEIRGMAEPFEIKPGHRFLSVLPFSHILPLIANALGPLCLGACVVFLSSISPQRIAEAFKRHRITFFICVPQFFYLLHKRIFSQVQSQPWIARQAFGILRRVARLIKNAEIRRRLFSRIHQTMGPDLRFFASGGSRFDPGVATDLSEFGYIVLNAYGLTETSAAVTATPVSQNRIGTVGKPVRGMSIRIDAPNDAGVGEVCIRGPLLMKGYYRDEAYTAENVRDGWLHTGDLGVIDSEENLTVTGRSKDVIVLANGKNIYPEELETHYAQSPFIEEICILGLPEGAEIPVGEKLHAIVVPDMDEFRRRGKSTIMEIIRFEMETLSKNLPSYQHVLSLSIRHEPFPRTVTRKPKRFEIQAEELDRRKKTASPVATEDHPRFKSGVGEIVASLIRKMKPDAGGLDPSSNIELDLGFDSLSRVELSTDIESATGLHIEEQEAVKIYTLGELLDALERQDGSSAAGIHGWKEILSVSSSSELEQHDILRSKPLSTATVILVARAIMLAGILLFKLRWRGRENIPKTGPFLICPNHESFLDAPILYASMPSRVIAIAFGLGYSDYWTGPISRLIARWCNIVAVDSNVHLVRAMQAAAVGLRHNKALVIFPEGTRSIDGRLTEFKKGAAILAYELGIPIVPVGINGTFEAWPRAGTLKRHPLEVVFGAPIDPGLFAGAPDPHAALTDHLHNVVRTLSRG